MPCGPYMHTLQRWVLGFLYFAALAFCIREMLCLQSEVFAALNATTTELHKAFEEALNKYDADKTGLVDFALKATGGEIVSIRDTQPFVVGWSYSYFGLKSCADIVPPSTILQAKTQPGECWPFVGSRGTAVIKLISPVVITGLTYEHAAKSLIINGDISSAPLEFTLKGLLNTDDAGFNFGKFVFDRNGPPMQYFPIKWPCNRPFEFAEFTVLSNNGNENFTCLYRVRIHGTVPS